MPGPIKLEVNHVEMLSDNGMEWSLNTEEVLGGTGRATLVVQDRTNDWEPQPHWDVKCTIRDGPLAGWVLFRGEIISLPLELPLAREWRSWKIDCADYNNELSQRLVGAFDGRYWQDIDGLGDFINVDPNAHSLATDRQTVQHLFEEYIRVDGEAFGTDTFVGEYIEELAHIEWDYGTLQGSLEDMARQVTDNLQFWSDPDLEFHWVVIPAWQDLLQHTVTVYGVGIVPGDDTESISGLGFGEFSPGDGLPLPGAPYRISDIRDDDDPNQLGAASFDISFDGANMPEQIYIRGSTGYVYNAGAIDPVGESTIINPTGYGSKETEKFRLTFVTSCKVWVRQTNGYIDPDYAMHSAGGPYDVKFVVIPVHPTTGLGGHFWQLLAGPHAGKFVDNDSNYFGYGTITVVKLTPTQGPPLIGIGGSGWTGEVLQDKNKRQAYLQADISDTQAKRDALGGQALYRASFPTLRGSLTVNGKKDAEAEGERISADGWRVGQVMRIEDVRFPTSLSDKSFMVQRVSTSLLEATDIREYDIDFGDGPESRWSMDAPPDSDEVTWPNPADMIVIEAFDLSPGPNSTQIIVGQLRAKDGSPWKIAGRVVTWTLEVYNAGGTLITGQGTINPEVSATDKNGRARTVLTTGSQTGLVYFVFAAVLAV